MISNEQRARTLERALRVGLAGDPQALRELCTEDVRTWTPSSSTSSADELVAQLERRDDAFSDVSVDTTPLDVGGEWACVEWTVTMRHTGRLVLSGGTSIEATDTAVTLHGVTVAEFAGDRICAVRQYWDEFAVLEQLGVLVHADDAPPR